MTSQDADFYKKETEAEEANVRITELAEIKWMLWMTLETSGVFE